MTSKRKRAPAKNAGASASASRAAKAKGSKQGKSKASAKKQAISKKGRKSKAGASGKKGPVRRAAIRKPVGKNSKRNVTASQKRKVQKPVETPILAHGPDQHFIPAHNTGTEMPQVNTRVDEQALHNREKAMMNQENQRVKQSMAMHGGLKRVVRRTGK